MVWRVLCKLSQESSSSTHPFRVICLSVNGDLTWMLFVNDREVTTTLCSVLHPFPHMLTSETFSRLLAKLDSLHIISFIWLQPRKEKLSLMKVELYVFLIIPILKREHRQNKECLL